VDLRFLLQGLRGTVEPIKRAQQNQRCLSSKFLHAPERPPRPLRYDRKLESRYKFQECIFEAVFSTTQGHRIYASRKVAEKIEVQTRYAAELYNMDVRQDQRVTSFHMETIQNSFTSESVSDYSRDTKIAIWSYKWLLITKSSYFLSIDICRKSI
jgi:hypothetical protein